MLHVLKYVNTTCDRLTRTLSTAALSVFPTFRLPISPSPPNRYTNRYADFQSQFTVTGNGTARAILTYWEAAMAPGVVLSTNPFDPEVPVTRTRLAAWSHMIHSVLHEQNKDYEQHHRNGDNNNKSSNSRTAKSGTGAKDDHANRPAGGTGGAGSAGGGLCDGSGGGGVRGVLPRTSLPTTPPSRHHHHHRHRRCGATSTDRWWQVIP
jgi:hypothetical protein